MLCSVPLSDVKAKSPRRRFNISLLSNQTFITSLKEYIKEFLEINMPSDVSRDPNDTHSCEKQGKMLSTGLHVDTPVQGTMANPSHFKDLNPHKTRTARYIACDSHAHLVSKDGSVVSRKSPSPVFKWSGI